MPRASRTASAASASIDDILRSAMEPVLKRVSTRIARAIADMAAQRVDRELREGVVRTRRGRGAGKKVASATASRRRVEIERWVPDRHARRVPNFVIEQAGGLDTKKKIVARYGPDAVFEKGKPAPRPK